MFILEKMVDLNAIRLSNYFGNSAKFWLGLQNDYDIEEELEKENAEYKYVRDSQLLDPPVLKVLKHGEFEKYRVKRVSEGANDSQFKFTELTADPEFQKNFAVEEEISLLT